MYKRKFIKYLAEIATPIETSMDHKRWEFKNKFLRLAGIKIGINTCISSGFQCITGQEENLIIGDHVALGHNVKLYNFGTIHIGSFTMFASDVSITNGGHDLCTLEPFSGNVHIGKGCWIGHAARIVRPVNIGDNVIIGAGAIVTKDIPSDSIALGSPAKIIKTRELPAKVWALGNIFYDPKTFQIVDT